MIKVTSTELQEKFGKYREAAMREPVAITSHGRESLVLLSAAEYARLKRRDRQVALVQEAPVELIEDILNADWAEEGAAFDNEIGDASS